MGCFDRIMLKVYERRYRKLLLKRFKPKRRMKIRPLTNDIYAIRMKDGKYTYIKIPNNDDILFDYAKGLQHVCRLSDNKVKVDEDKLDQPKKDWLNKNKDKDPEELI